MNPENNPVRATREEALKAAVVQYFIDHSLTVSTAESCTAGMICAAIGDFPGVSAILSQGFITYSNEAKETLLGVPHETLVMHGAVSEETARAMAEGVCQRTGANVGIAATGIAGPGGGTEEKPVGLVYVGVCIRGETTVRRLLLKGSRTQVRQQTVYAAFAEVKNRLRIPVK